VTLQRSDFDQAARYLRCACELLDRDALDKIETLPELLEMVARRLCSGYVCRVPHAEITMLRQAVEVKQSTLCRSWILLGLVGQPEIELY
jgi:hypothetical protein